MVSSRPLRIVLIGAESTGKTTLCEQLATHYDTEWVPEYGREHWEQKISDQHLKGGEIPSWTDDEFIHIAEEQQRRENEAAARVSRLLICDTNAFATGTWFERYAGHRHRLVDAIGARDTVDLYLIPTPDVPFVQDGVRDGEQIRDWMHGRFLELVQATGTPYILLAGAWEQRIQQATFAIDLLLSGVTPMQSAEFRIRRATARDAGMLAQIGAATFLETYPEIIPGPDMVEHCAAQHSISVYERYLADPACTVWLAEYMTTGAPVGYAVNCPPDLPVAKEDGDVELKRIYVFSRFHGAGLGRILMLAALHDARLRRASRLLLGAYGENRRAIRFYQKHGFEQIGTRKFLVGEQFFDDVVLAARL